MIHLRTLPLTPALLVFAAIVLSLTSSVPSFALTGWKAGRIINDEVFTDYNSMSVSQIQSFLQGRVPSCDTNGQQLSDYGGPDLNGDGKVQRWEWGKANYNQIKFVCLKDYVAGGKKASQIIYDKAQQYNISPKVLLVLLQKEQSLVNDTWPLNVQYRTATGYGCPDTAPCDSQYYGLANQLDWAAKMFRSIMNNSPTWYTPYEVGTNYVQYNPQSSCGGTNVFIENRATQALYNYTPYQPNKGALDAGWGSAPPCGAYGNRNFYLYFTSWFGRPNGNPYKSLDQVRWMQTNKSTTKYDLVTEDPVDGALSSGTQLYFVDKIQINGEWYLRTQYDSTHNYQKGIRLSDLIDIPYTTIADPRYMQISGDTYKYTPQTLSPIKSEPVSKNITLMFASSIEVNGITYYRTSYDTSAGVTKGIPASATKEIAFTDFLEPRYMQLRKTQSLIDPIRGASSTENAAAGSQVHFDSKVLVGGNWYYRPSAKTAAASSLAIPASSVSDIPYVSIGASKWMQLKHDSAKYDPQTGEKIADLPLSHFEQIKFAQKITVNGVSYYRTDYDMKRQNAAAIPLLDVEDVPYVSLDTPRKISLRHDAIKYNPMTGVGLSDTLRKGQAIYFDTKIYVNGVWYLRSSYDTQFQLHKAVRKADLAI